MPEPISIMMEYREDNTIKLVHLTSEGTLYSIGDSLYIGKVKDRKSTTNKCGSEDDEGLEEETNIRKTKYYAVAYIENSNISLIKIPVYSKSKEQFIYFEKTGNGYIGTMQKSSVQQSYTNAFFQHTLENKDNLSENTKKGLKEIIRAKSQERSLKTIENIEAILI